MTRNKRIQKIDKSRFADFAHICGFLRIFAHLLRIILVCFSFFSRKKVKQTKARRFSHRYIYIYILYIHTYIYIRYIYISLPKDFRMDRLQQADGRSLPAHPPMWKESLTLALMQVALHDEHHHHTRIQFKWWSTGQHWSTMRMGLPYQWNYFFAAYVGW